MGKVLIALSVAGAFALTGCDTGNPCDQLPPPTPEQNAVAMPPVEVEQPGRSDYDCKLVGGIWTPENDD